MKTIIVLISTFLLHSCCCDYGKKKYRTYVIENGTERAIKMELYLRKRLKSTREIVGKGVLFEGRTDDGVGGHLGAPGALSSDSIVVVFDDERIQIYHRGNVNNGIASGVGSKPKTNRNIYIDSVYTIVNDEYYRFTYTEEDYQNAEEL